MNDDNTNLSGQRRGPRASKTRSFPNQLRRLRWNTRNENGKGLTLKEVAEKVTTEDCPVYWQHLGSAERTGKGLNRCAWYALADFFNVDPRELERPDPVADFYSDELRSKKSRTSPAGLT